MEQICPNCGASLAEGQVFCSACGARLVRRTCANCGAELKEGQFFCPVCGQRADAPQQETPPYNPPQQEAPPYIPPQQEAPPYIPPQQEAPPYIPQQQETPPYIPPQETPPYIPPQPPVYPPQQPYPQQPYSQYPPQPPRKKSKAPLIVALVLAGVLLAGGLFALWYFVLRVPPVEQIQLNETSVSLYEDDTFRLRYEITPSDASDADFTWKSSDRDVATVEDGEITAVGIGECTITVTAKNGVSAECEVTVAPQLPEEVSMIVGRWDATLFSTDDGVLPYDGDDAFLQINEDGSAVIQLDTDRFETDLVEYEYIDSDGDYKYTITFDGEEVTLYYIADTSSSIYGNLLLLLDSGMSILFEK